MAIVTRAAVRRGILNSDVSTRILNAIKRSNLPVYCPYSAADMAMVAALDKKAAASDITVILPEQIGVCRIEKLPITALEALFAEGLEGQA